MNKEMKSVQKVLPVIKVFFPIAAKKYPMFFVWEVLKTIIDFLMPFIGIIFTPLLVDELCTTRDLKKLITYALILVIGEFVSHLILEFISRELQKYQQRLDNYFAVEMGRHSMELDFQLTEDKAALDQLEKAKNGISWYSGGAYGIAEQLFMFVGNVLKITGFSTLIIIKAPLLLLLIILYVGINAFFTSKCNAIEIKAYSKLSMINRLFGYFGWTIVDFRYGKDIRLYDAGDMLVERWDTNTEKSVAIWKSQCDDTFRYRKWGSLAQAVTTTLVYFCVGLLAVKGMISVGTFTQMIETAGALDATLGGLVWNIQELLKRSNYAYEYVLFMNYPEAIVKGHNHVDKKLHRIEFRDVSFAYPGTDRMILNHINLTVEPGEKLSIVGLNGAGKTTLIKLLCRLYDPTSGQILLDERDIKEYEYKEYMEQFAPVFQDFKLFAFTIGENISLCDSSKRTEEDKKRIQNYLETVEVDNVTDKLSKGMDTKIFKIFDEEGIEPSGGEQQKIAIARALYKDAPVIILDEPTAALDPVAEYEIYRQFSTLVGDKTAFYISHRLSSCKFCDKIAVFNGGIIAEYGSHDDLVDLPGGIYAKMFEAQAQYYR